MESTSDTYKTVAKPSPEILLKEKKSKFYGYTFPLESEDEVKPLLEQIQKKHPPAGHVCYAWQIGTEQIRYRANDDGEPKNSAGMPIYGQIRAFGLTNVLVVVSRIFAGSKLGIGGLITAYRTSAQMALESSEITVKTLKHHFKIGFRYVEMDVVMRTIKQRQLEIITQELEINCEIIVAVRANDAEKTKAVFEGIYGIHILPV